MTKRSIGLLMVSVLITMIGVSLWWMSRAPRCVVPVSPSTTAARDAADEALLRLEVLACSAAQGEEYVQRRDALVAKLCQSPYVLESAVSEAKCWEQRVLAYILMEYVRSEQSVRAFVEWVPADRRMTTREQDEPTLAYGNDFAEHARTVPMILVESLWKGTNEKFRSQYMSVSRWNQQVVVQALGVLRERRAREVIESFMLCLPTEDGNVWGSPDSASATAARALGEIGDTGSVPALLAAIEKGVYGGSVGPALRKCMDASSLPVLRASALNSPDARVRATASALVQELETRP